MKEPQTTTLTARVTPAMKRQFVTKANREPNKTPSDVLRDLVAVYLSNQPTKETAK